MRKNVFIIMCLVMGFCLLTSHVYAADYRLAVETNGRVFRQGQVLKVGARILNDSENMLKFPGGPIPIPVPFPKEEIEALEMEEDIELLQAELDEELVDVSIRPVPLPRTVGYGRLVYLGPQLNNDVNAMPYPGKVFRLPRFGNGIVPQHSTAIISLANVYLGPYHYPYPALDNALSAEVESVDAVAICPITRPGFYLLDIFVWDRNTKTCADRAQKIIRIKRRRPLIEAEISKEPLSALR